MGQSESFKVFFQNGVGVYAGHVQETKIHSHHATEIIFGLTGSFMLADSKNDSGKYTLSIIPHNVKHRFINNSEIVPVFIYIDPFHHLAQRLTKSFTLDKEIVGIDTLPDGKVINKLNSWLNGNDIDIMAIVTQIVNQLTGQASHDTQFDDRIVESINHIKDALNTDLRLEEVASRVHLSGSRYAHLFKEHVGIPFRRFVLWTRLQTTVESILKGNSLTSACYDGGFADLSHFTKTFVAMFGVTPSSVLKG